MPAMCSVPWELWRLCGWGGGDLANGAAGETALASGHAKVGIGIVQAIAFGILCHALVCLAVWLTIGGHTVTDKILATIFPSTAFVTAGMEHSIASWFFLPCAYLLGVGETGGFLQGAGWNLLAVSFGNVLGGDPAGGGSLLAGQSAAWRAAGSGREGCLRLPWVGLPHAAGRHIPRASVRLPAARSSGR